MVGSGEGRGVGVTVSVTVAISVTVEVAVTTSVTVAVAIICTHTSVGEGVGPVISGLDPQLSIIAGIARMMLSQRKGQTSIRRTGSSQSMKMPIVFSFISSPRLGFEVRQ